MPEPIPTPHRLEHRLAGRLGLPPFPSKDAAEAWRDTFYPFPPLLPDIIAVPIPAPEVPRADP